MTEGVTRDARKTGRTLWSARLVHYGLFVAVVAAIALVAFYWQLIVTEVAYRLIPPRSDQYVALAAQPSHDGDVMVAADPTFSIVVPKIGANAPVVPDVDPYDEGAYRAALRKGVAHASPSVMPGERGNTFLFAHSSDDAYARNRYNTVFYLLTELVPGDRFYIVRDGTVYAYRVYESREVAPDDVAYLFATSEYSVATLMTCIPAGTTARRLLVFGVLEAVHADGIAPLRP